MWLASGIAVAVGRPAAVALIRPLVWELPYAVGASLKRKIKQTKITTAAPTITTTTKTRDTTLM